MAEPTKPSLNFMVGKQKPKVRKAKHDIDMLGAVDLPTETFGASLFIGNLEQRSEGVGDLWKSGRSS